MPDNILLNPVTQRPASPVQDVFGAERNTPHAVFNRSRQESGWTPTNPNGTVTANHRPNDLAMGCPTCRAEGTPGVRMFAREGVGYYCIAKNHTWKDIDALMALNPEKLEFRARPARQEGFRKVEIEVPGSIAEDFMKKFGDRGAATISGIMRVLSAERSMILTEENLKNIEDRIGEPVGNPAWIAGKLYQLKTELEEQKQVVTRLRNNLQTAARGSRVQVSDSTVVVDFGDELGQKLGEAASSHEWSVEAYVQEAVRLAIEGGWL
jgi:hypothetical protein